MAIQVLASNEIPWKPVESSNLEAYHYDQAQEALYIKFKPSKKSPNAYYIYPEVKQEVVTAFEGAESHGKFFIAEIKPHYDADRFIKVDPDAPQSETKKSK